MIYEAGIVGVGSRGQDIAQLFAEKGVDIYILDKNKEFTDNALNQITININNDVCKWRLGFSEKRAILSRIKPVYTIEAFKELPLIVEAVSEIKEIKKSVYLELSKVVNKEAIVITTTPSFTVKELSEFLKFKDRFLGVNFFHPAPCTPAVEVIKNNNVSSDVLKKVGVFLKDVLEKEVIEIEDIPGHITVRIKMLLINEAVKVIEEGVASPEVVDNTVRNALGMMKGPISMADNIGIDYVFYTLKNLLEIYKNNSYQPAKLLEIMVKENKLGRKTGIGFFTYDKFGNKENK